MHKLEVLAVIPARGGSLGLPRKNVAWLRGHPLVAWSVTAAKKSRFVTRTVVLSDDDSIREAGERYGAEPLQEPDDMSGPHDSADAAVFWAMKKLRERDGYTPDLVVLLQATSPLRSPSAVDGCIKRLLESDFDSVFSACHLEGFVWRDSRNGATLPVNYDFKERPRRQEASHMMMENGSIYVAKAALWDATGLRMGGKIGAFVMPVLHSLQVDTSEDLANIESLAGARESLIRPPIERPAAVVFDFDGVMTDDRVTVTENGEESIVCSRSDGLGVAAFKEAGILMAVLSGEANRVVGVRCEKLGIPCFQSATDKLPLLRSLAAEWGLGSDDIAYVGNQANDIECLAWAGIPVAVADAALQVKQTAGHVLRSSGGSGVVWELAELFQL